MTSAVVTLLGLVSVVSAQVDESPPAAPPAPAEPLLVVVERGHGATASPEAVRRAIADELKRPVVGPTDAAGKAATQMLVVTLAADSVAMQMRAAGDGAAPRRIQPVAAGDSGLRIVAWLAGNLARDQASELMDALPAAASAASPPAADPPRAAPTEPPPVEPAPAAVATTAPAKEPAPSAGSPWRIEVSLGRSGGGYLSYWFQNWPSLSSTRVDVLAPFRTDHWSWTAGFEVFGESQHSSSWATSGGCVRRFALLPGWLAADASIGGGLAVSRLTFNQQTETGRLDLQTITRGPNLFGQVAGNLAFVRFQLGEIVAGVRIHEYPEFWDQPMFTLAAGLRIGIP